MIIHKPKFNTGILTDIIVVFACIAAVFMYLEYAHEIREEIDVVLTEVLNDFNGSVANTSTTVK